MKPFHLQPAMLSLGGVFYPTGYMFLMFPSAQDAQRAADMLVADGYDGESVSLLTPQLIQDQLGRLAGDPASAPAPLEAESNTVLRFVDLARQGHHALMIHAPTPHETEHILHVLKDARISHGQKYRRLAIDEVANANEPARERARWSGASSAR
jgi:hypothetical protein